MGSDTCGVTRFAASPTPKCPMNTFTL